MSKIKTLIKKIKQKPPYNLMLGYFLIVLLPIIIFVSYMYKSTLDNYLQSKTSSLQALLDEKVSSINMQMNSIEDIWQGYQYNSTLVMYLAEHNLDPGLDVYTYLKYIAEIFDYSRISHKDLSNIAVYKITESLVSFPNNVLKYNSFNKAKHEIENISQLDLTRGVWIFSEDEKEQYFMYLRYIYNKGYYHPNGILELMVNKDKIYDPFRELEDSYMVEFFLDGNEEPQQQNTLSANVYINKLKMNIRVSTPISKAIEEGLYFGGIWIMVILFLVLSILYYFLVVSKYIDLTVKFYKTQIAKNQYDYMALKAQIRSHFLYNALENIRMQAVVSKNTNISNTVYHLGRYIRYNLSDGAGYRNLAEEIDNVRNYLEIYMKSMSDYMNYCISVDDDAEKILCPGFILQPLAENAIHYAISDSHPKIHIVIDAKIYPSQTVEGTTKVIITVKDDGVGIEAENLNIIHKKLEEAKQDYGSNYAVEKGVGLTNVMRRLLLFDKIDTPVFTVESILGFGTICTIEFSVKRGTEDETGDC